MYLSKRRKKREKNRPGYENGGTVELINPYTLSHRRKGTRAFENPPTHGYDLELVSLPTTSVQRILCGWFHQAIAQRCQRNPTVPAPSLPPPKKLTLDTLRSECLPLLSCATGTSTKRKNGFAAQQCIKTTSRPLGLNKRDKNE